MKLDAFNGKLNLAAFDPSVVFLIVALALSFIASISLPFFPAIDVVRVHANGIPINKDAIREARFGIWAECSYNAMTGDRSCTPTGHGYSFAFQSADKKRSEVIGASWTRGLAVTPVATCVTAVALALSLVPGDKHGLHASLTSFLAAFLMLLAFIIDIALVSKVNAAAAAIAEAGKSTHAGAGFWLTLVSFVFLCVAGYSSLTRHKRANGGDVELGSFLKPFKR